MVIIHKTFTRDFSVLLCQIWGRRYTNFFNTEIKTAPKNIFVFKDGLVDVYRNLPELTDEINGIFETKQKKDPTFLKSFVKTYLKKLRLLSALTTKKASKKTLLQFADQLHDLWYLFYVGLYLPSNKRIDEHSRKIIMKARHESQESEYAAFTYIENSLKKLFRELGDYAKYISREELRNGNIPSLAKLKNRSKNLVIFDDLLITKTKLKSLEKKLKFKLELQTNTIKRSSIKGRVAFPGKVQGRIRKIFKSSDVLYLKKGEVLLTYMTTPDFIPAMKKASAFVTDEGGITSHAAITAREMKKPCVIGTKIATKIFKNGDLVEVNANNGIVRKLNI